MVDLFAFDLFPFDLFSFDFGLLLTRVSGASAPSVWTGAGGDVQVGADARLLGAVRCCCLLLFSGGLSNGGRLLLVAKTCFVAQVARKRRHGLFYV